MAVKVEKLVKSFGEQTVLHALDFQIADGEFVSISGKSGSGKTTLLYILSTLDKPTSGRVEIDGIDPVQLSVEDIHRFRNERLGFIFQFHYLLPELSALENVLLPTRKNKQQAEYQPLALALLERFGLQDKSHRLPSQLSGGEQQRVAIARALIKKPKYIFADEPTGSLDTTNSEIVMRTLSEVHRDEGTTLVLVTHDPDYAAWAGREIRLVDGHLEKAET